MADLGALRRGGDAWGGERRGADSICGWGHRTPCEWGEEDGRRVGSPQACTAFGGRSRRRRIWAGGRRTGAGAGVGAEERSVTVALFCNRQLFEREIIDHCIVFICSIANNDGAYEVGAGDRRMRHNLQGP